MTTGIRELRADLANHVRRAGEGERTVVTIDGQPVAQLGPINPSGSPTLDDLAAMGLVRTPRRRNRPSRPPTTRVPVDMRADRVIAELRGDQSERSRR